MARSIDDILNGDALTWSRLSAKELRIEHELLRRALETSRLQVSALVERVVELSRKDKP